MVSYYSGTVVMIDPVEGNRVLPASQPYYTRVARVVSAQPGIILGEPGDDKVKVAHSGQGRCPIRADQGGRSVSHQCHSRICYALKAWCFNGISMHRPGSIISKALEPRIPTCIDGVGVESS